MYSNEQAKNVTFRTDERMTYGAMNYDGDGLNFERVQHVILCWYYGTDWSWTDNNTVLYTCPDSYTEGGRLYGEMEIIVK